MSKKATSKQKSYILQQKTKHCRFCNKEQKHHSEKLWKIHEGAIEIALKSTRHKKIWSMYMGFGPTCRAVLSDEFAYDKGYILAEWLKPIFIPCSQCGRFLGKIEEEHADVLDNLCLECFKQSTGQEDGSYSPDGNSNDSKTTKPVRNIWSGEMVT